RFLRSQIGAPKVHVLFEAGEVIQLFPIFGKYRVTKVRRMDRQPTLSVPQSIPVNLYFFYLLVVLFILVLLFILFGLFCLFLYFFQQSMVILVQIESIPTFLGKENGVHIVLGGPAGGHAFQPIPVAEPKYLLATIHPFGRIVPIAALG